MINDHRVINDQKVYLEYVGHGGGEQDQQQQEQATVHGGQKTAEWVR